MKSKPGWLENRKRFAHNCYELKDSKKLLSTNIQKRYFFSYSNMKSNDPYVVLGILRSASSQEIKSAYFREAKKYHPDLNPDDNNAREKFQKISEAYDILSGNGNSIFII